MDQSGRSVALDVELSETDVNDLTAVAGRIDIITGDRYPESMQRWINR